MTERDDTGDGKRRDSDKARAIAAAPWAEKLKNGDFVKNLMGLATRAGYSRRLKVHLLWNDTTFRLEAGARRLELRPQKDGVAAVHVEIGPDGLRETGRELLNLRGNPQTVLDRWLKEVDAWQKQEKEAEAAAMAALATDDEV